MSCVNKAYACDTGKHGVEPTIRICSAAYDMDGILFQPHVRTPLNDHACMPL